MQAKAFWPPSLLPGRNIRAASCFRIYNRGVKAIALKTILFMLLIPVPLIGALPIWLVRTDPALFSFGLFRWLAVPLWAAGAAVVVWCAWAFTVRGRGTPSPTNPPRELVASGLYRFVRNPIYLSVVVVFLGYLLWHPSRALLLCPLIVAVSSHLFVIFYEEPHLRKTFGAAYTAYCQSVPRWLPKFSREDQERA
jgi:protein-S-isoprenylcysteine O-methyltransferase Ste14